MRQLFRIFLAPVCLTASLAAMTHAAVTPGATAPDFTLTAVDGKPVSLSQFRGKYVVLEWFNSECPFVQKHYTTGNMQKLQSRYTSEGIVWLAINSTNPEHSNYRDPQRSREIMSQWKGSPTALLLDPEGGVGQAYEARTTPHMYIIDPEGKLIYQGAIDSIKSVDAGDIEKADNYVALALDAALAGRPIDKNVTAPYGCSVKY